MSDTTEKKKVAVVLSGGGANGAYEVGVLKALMSGKSSVTNYQPLDPDIFTGTSIGSFNASFLVSQWDRYGTASVANLEKMWLEQLAGDWGGNGAFRIRGNPFSYLRTGTFTEALESVGNFLEDGGKLAWEGFARGYHFTTSVRDSWVERAIEMLNLSSFVSTEPMEQTLSMLNYQNIRRSRRRLRVAATNWATGELRDFWNHDMTDRFGPVAIGASSAIPGFFPPVRYGAQPFVDGSVLLNSPMRPAIRAGADILHVIYLDPDIKNIPLSHLRNTYESFLRMMQITWANSYNNDIEAAARINRGLEAIERIRRGEVSDLEKDFFLAVPDLKRFESGYRPLTIYRYHPQDPLEGDLGFLNFGRERVEALIDRGFQDTVNHDWEMSADVFPVGVAKPAKPHEKPALESVGS